MEAVSRKVYFKSIKNAPVAQDCQAGTFSSYEHVPIDTLAHFQDGWAQYKPRRIYVIDDQREAGGLNPMTFNLIRDLNRRAEVLLYCRLEAAGEHKPCTSMRAAAVIV